MITEEKLIRIIESSLELEEGTVESEDKGWYSLWDSLAHLSILVALDKALDGKCSSISELSTATSITAIKNILKLNNLLEG
tara:strand:- start:1686 stop:1928 length:243 start_codon:yes stop_codon:yes gene_type:complete